MAQYGLPIADVEKVNWVQGAGDGDANLWNEVEEGLGAGRGTGSGPDDSTSYWWGGGAGGTEPATLTSSSLTDPLSSTGHILRQRVCKTDATGALSASGKQMDVRIQLREAGLTVAVSPQATQTNAWSTQTYTLTGTQADAIVSYAGLGLRCLTVPVGGGSTRYIGLSAIEFEIPDAAGGATPTITDVETDEQFTDADTGVTITGTNFEATQGTGTVELASTSTYATATKVAQTVTSWSATAIDFTASLGGLTAGALFLFVTNNSGSRNTAFAVTVNAVGGPAHIGTLVNNPFLRSKLRGLVS